MYKRLLGSVALISLAAHITVAGIVGLDASFNGIGYRSEQFAPDGAWCTSLAIQADGKILAGGTLFNYGQNSVNDFAAMRLLPGGQFDSLFDSDGRVSTNFGFFDFSDSMAIQPDGKIVMAGSRYSGSTYYDFAALRYHPNGSLDNSFDGNGVVATNRQGTSDDRSYAIAIQPDGKIVLVGTTAVWGTPEDNFPPDLMIVRYNPDGSLDSTFLGGGLLVISFPDLRESANAVVLQPDGKILIGGFLNTGTKNNFLLLRLMPGGTIDASFGPGGVVVTSINETNNEIRSLSLQSDGKILAGGSVTNGGAIVRYAPDGTIDNSFGNNGILTTTTFIRKLIVASDDKILAAGTLSQRFAITRFTREGAPDSSFNNGQAAIALIPNHECGSHVSFALQSDEKIVIGGTCTSSSLPRMVVARLKESSRTPSYDFDGDGKADIGIFRPIAGASEWWINRSGNGQTFALQFGSSTDRIAPADYTGDGKADIAFFRPASGEWYVLRSEDFSFFALPFGTNGDIPVPADYDADGKADFAVFRPSSSTWFISQSSGAPTRIEQFGVTGDQPVVADYDGDNKADVGIFRNNAGVAEWWINRSTAGVLAIQFGASTDKAVQGDYTGDGKADIAIWRPSNGNWMIVRSEDFSFFGFPFGANGDVPSPGDYDGDGKFDPTVFRPSSATWFIGRTTAGTQIVQFGATGDRPIPNAFVP